MADDTAACTAPPPRGLHDRPNLPVKFPVLGHTKLRPPPPPGSRATSACRPPFLPRTAGTPPTPALPHRMRRLDNPASLRRAKRSLGPRPKTGGHLFCPRQPRPRNFSHASALHPRRPPSILTIQLGRLRETSASRRSELKAGLLFAAARNEKRRLGPPVLGGVFVWVCARKKRPARCVCGP
jgi:hypothetical protein